MTIIAPEQILDETQIDQCFPRDSYRPLQREVIQAIVQRANAGYKYIIAECPTGSGKSVIAVTLARLAGLHQAYYITTTKHLQDQIESDFGDIVTLKGRNAYPCTVHQHHHKTLQYRNPRALEILYRDNPRCDEGYCKSTGRSSCNMCVESSKDVEENGGRKYPLPAGMMHSSCPYFEQFFRGVYAQTTSMNFNNFILHINFGGKYRKRRILIIDEAHNTEEKLLGFLSCQLDSRSTGQFIPQLDHPIDYVNWIIENGVMITLKNKFMDASENNDAKMMNIYESLIRKYDLTIREIQEDPHGWVSEYKANPKTHTTTVDLKPIFAKKAAHKYLFEAADIVVFLSATVLNANSFARNLGIDEGEYTALQTPSTFPVANRPIVIDYAGRFVGGKAKMDGWIKDMAKKVTNIADRYTEHRGIIHTHSFGIQTALMEALPNRIKSRLIDQYAAETKTEVIEIHAARPGSILIAPAMHEGVDLKDDLSRFQIVCKVPYANFYDNKQLAARMELDKEYYDYITILKIVQSVGRSVRSETDWADTFIIDEAFNRLYYGNKHSFPMWFQEAITKIIPNVK